MDDKIFKGSLEKIFKEQFGEISKIRYAFLELDNTQPKQRIEYPGYDKNAQFSGGYDSKNLPGFRSCVRIVLFVNQINRLGYTRRGKNRWLGSEFSDGTKEDNGDAAYYEGNIYLFIAGSVLSEEFKNKSNEEKLKELVEYSKVTVEQLDSWGVYPIFHEPIPEINGCIPEQIYPHTSSYLQKMLKKISENIVLSYKASFI